MADSTQTDGLDPVHLQELGEAPGWPKVVGIISIVWGGLGTTCAACGLAVMPALPALMGKPDEPLPPTMQMTPLMLALYVAGILQALLLIAAGVLTLKRKPAGRGLHLFYAATALVLAPLGLYITWRNQQLMGPWVIDHPESPFSKQYKPGAAPIGMAVQGVFAFAWPIFTLIWFGLVKRSGATMQGTVGPAPGH